MRVKLFSALFAVFLLSGCATTSPETIPLEEAARELAKAITAFDEQRRSDGATKDLIVDELSATLSLSVVKNASTSASEFRIGNRLYGFNLSKTSTAGNVLVLKFKSADKAIGTHNKDETVVTQDEEKPNG